MRRSEIYNEITNSFERKYSWLGKQFSEELLLSAASWNIQQYSSPDFRIRRHLLLFWPPGFLKSTLLMKASDLFSPQLCTVMSDVTLAALRGTVEAGSFVSPFTLKRPFSICSEFGQIVTGRENEVVQKLLNVMEEGVVTVSLGKIAYLTGEQREEASEKYGISFIDRNTFTYKTNWILIAGTYNKKFLVDSALESRFNIMIPEKKLDSDLTKHVNNSGQFILDEEVKAQFRHELLSNGIINISSIKLPDEIYDNGNTITPRECGGLVSYIACRAWWNISTSKDEIIQMAETMKQRRQEIWLSAEDRVFNSIEHQAKGVDEIATELDVTTRTVYYALKKMRAIRILTDDGDAKYRIY